MTVTDVIEQLNTIQMQVPTSTKKDLGAKSIYLAAGWFDELQTALLLDAYRALLQNPTIAHIHVPLLHQYGGEEFIEDGEFSPNFEWATMTYKSDVKAIDNSDLVVALFPAESQDIGTAMEVGYAVASHKPVITTYTGDLNVTPINLMISFGADSFVLDPKELINYNFLDITPRKYSGAII